MGMDASFSIWVGVNDEEQDFLKNNEDKLPSEFFDGELLGDAVIGDFAFETFYCGDEIIGYGIGIFYHDWDYGVSSFNVLEIVDEIEKTKKILKDFFDKQGISEEINVWCQANFR